MLGYLLILLLLLPFLDFYLLVKLAGVIGFPETVAVVIATGLVGVAVLKREGRGVLHKLQASVTAKEVSRNMVEALLLVLGGLMLLSPGLVTDALGFLMVWRPTRVRLMLRLVERLEHNADIRFEVRQF